MTFVLLSTISLQFKYSRYGTEQPRRDVSTLFNINLQKYATVVDNAEIIDTFLQNPYMIIKSSYLTIIIVIDSHFWWKGFYSIRQLTLNGKHSYSYYSRGKILFSYLLMHHHIHCWDQHWWCVSQTIEENHRHQSQYIKRGIIIVVINIIIDADLRCFDCSYSFG